MAQISNCLKLISKIDERDQDALVARLDELQAQGVPAEKAQIQAAIDVLTRVQRDSSDANGGVALASKARAAMNSGAEETPEFKRWSGGAPLVRLGESHEYRSGEPVVVEALHGTTNSDLTEFKRERANIESDWGAGFYASNTPDDVAANYANNDGKDLTNRIELTAERLAQDFDDDMDAARAEARRRLTQESPNTMKLFVRFENPAVLGGDAETFLDYNEEYNEETDEYEEPTGSLVGFVDALREAAGNFDVEDGLSDFVDGLFSQASGNGGVKLSDVRWQMNNTPVYVYDTNGNSAIHELVRMALEGAGFDGVVDTTVGSKFKGMKGMDKDTVHFIAFEPTQLKSATGNRGTFDPSNANITRSVARPEFFSQLQRAIEQVPDRLATMAAPQWKLWLDANAPKLGIKKDEIEFSGVKDYLTLRGKDKVTRDELVAYLSDSGVRVQEVVLGSTGLRDTGEIYVAEANDWGDEWAVFTEDGSIIGGTYESQGAAEQAMDEMNSEGKPTKYGSYTVPGGENYREVLITLPPVGQVKYTEENVVAIDDADDPNRSVYFWRFKVPGNELQISRQAYRTQEEAKAYILSEKQPEPPADKNYKSSHWNGDHLNILAHLRVDDRVDADGARVLFLNEIQSDWGQDGKKNGFANDKAVAGWTAKRAEGDPMNGGEIWEVRDAKGNWVVGIPVANEPDEKRAILRAAGIKPGGESMVPMAPFVTDTKAWASLALKRAIMMAVEGGYDRVALITGEQAAGLYSLDKQIDSLTWIPNNDGTFDFEVLKDDVTVLSNKKADASWLEDHIGKEFSKKIIDDDHTTLLEKSGRRFIEGDGLKLPATGMRQFYDQIIPQVARDVLKKLGGGQLQSVGIQMGDEFAGSRQSEYHKGEGIFVELRSTKERIAGPFDTHNDAARWMKENPESLPQPGFDITPAMREKVASGVPLFSKTRPQSASEPYVEDLYGQPIDTQPTEPGVSRNAQRKPRVRDTDAPEGIYHINTVVAIERKQKLGAKRITNAAELAAATAHLRKSAVERFDGVVTDAKGKPLAIVGSFKGALSQAAVYPSTIIAEAVRVPGAARIWFSHNHPSGTPSLSSADHNLYRTLANAFSGSGIEPMGLIAVARDRFGFTDGNGESTGRAPDAIDGSSVYIYERELAGDDPNGLPVLSTPEIARDAAKGAYALNKEPGVLLLDSQHRVVAVVPIDPEVGKKLRGTGGLNSIFRSVSQSNAGAAIIYHAGEYDLNGGGELVSPLLNIGAALNLVDVRPLDAINVKTNESRAENGLAMAAGPVFSKGRTTGDYGRAYTAEQQEMFKNTGRTVAPQTLIERVKEARSDMWKKMAQGIVDQFRPIRDLGGDAYTLARLSKGSAGAFEALLNYGKLSIVDGAYDADMSGGFIKTIGEPLGAELEDFAWWVASNRAERLAVEDRENLFTRRDIDAGKSLAQGTLPKPYTKRDGTTTVDRAEAYADSLVKFNEFNKNVLDIAEQSGLIDGEARKIWENEFYVPFYRVSEEDGQFMGAKIKGGLARQRAFQELKGGSQKLNSDLLANTMKNWAHLIDASAKNRAAKATLEAAEMMNVAIEADAEAVRQLGKNIGGKGGTVWFMDGGQQRHFVVGDPHLLAAINSLEYAGLRGPLMDALSTTKHWLTVGVTASPAFKVRNLIRDSLQAISVSDLSYNPIANMKDGIKASARDSQTYVSALASGGLIRFGTMMEGNGPERVRRLVQKGVNPSTILDSEAKIKAFYSKTIEPVVDAYNELGNRGEEINRAALYSQLRKQGKSHAEAALLSRDLLDFSMQGTWASIRFLTQVVPFLNARLQGLYKLGRGASEDPRKFAITTGAVAMVSIALMAAYADDEDWKKREDWDRDTNWWFKIGGTAFRIPKPFEIGAIGTLAERGVELFVNDEFTLKRFLGRVKHIASDNLAMNPVPQAIKPIIDVYANKDAFSGRPIESMGMERLQSEYRYTANTSMVARGASTALNTISRNTIGEESLSPVQIDSMLRGYFGWLGTFIVGGADMLARPLTDEPSRPQADYLKVVTQGIARQLPEPSSKYVSAVYDQAKILEQAYATHRQLIREGKVDDAREFAEDNADLLRRHRLVERVKGAQSQINRTIREIERSDMDPKKKREEIQKLRDRQSKIAAEVY